MSFYHDLYHSIFYDKIAEIMCQGFQFYILMKIVPDEKARKGNFFYGKNEIE